MQFVRDVQMQMTLGAYDPSTPLDRARTIPSAWYTDPRVAAVERDAVFGRTWQYVARFDLLREPGDYVTADVAGEPIVVVRGRDGEIRAFHNVCRHHAAAVMTEPAGRCQALVCPYHGWTYSLDGRLKGVPGFEGVCDFDKADNGLVPVAVETWEGFVFVNLSDSILAPTISRCSPLREHLGDMAARVAKLSLSAFRFYERRSYELNCNWKVYVDNYLDGGYHVPFIHKGLGSVLDDSAYKIENGERFCVQSSPLSAGSGDAATASVRKGDMAYYFWLYPNFMLNWYEGVMDVNLVMPLAVDRCRVIFDFFFTDDAGLDEEGRGRSVVVAERVQQEDIDICESVQRGLCSRAYDTGRLSVRREAGEHLFHRLLHADLTSPDGHVAKPAPAMNH